MLEFQPIFQTLFTLMGVVAFLAIGYVAFRSRLPNETIKIQNDNIAALIESDRLKTVQIKELNAKVTVLEARNSIIETLPLKDINDTQKKILGLLEIQNKILTEISSHSNNSIFNVGKQ